MECEDAMNQSLCLYLRDEGEQSCYWNSTSSACIPLRCGQLPTEDECNRYSDEYACKWSTFYNTQLGQITNPSTGELEVCLTECPTNIDIVFIIDLSRSVIDGESNANNPVIIGDFIQSIMDTQWKIANQLNKSAAFGLVTFPTDAATEFDLNAGYDENYSDHHHLLDCFVCI